MSAEHPGTAALVARLAGAALVFRAAALQALWRKANFDPNQPRVPRGHPDGGQWTRVGVGDDAALILVNDKPSLPNSIVVDLLEEEAAGGHTIAAHIGRSPQSLLARVRGERFVGLFLTVTRYRDGSFPSIGAATKLVNATLSRNRPIVESVAAGTIREAFVTASFRSRTGIEAFRQTENANPYLRDTYGVGVYIVHDDGVAKGFIVVTAYPRND